MVRAAHHFCCIVPVNISSFLLSFHGGFPVPRFFLGKFPCSCLGCPFFCFLTERVSLWLCSDHCCGSDLSGQALPLRWGGTSHLVPPHRGAVCHGRHQITNTQVCECFGQPAQASPLGHFRHSRCLNELDQPFDLLKEVLLGQFGKSNWQSCFELLRLPVEM